MALRDGLVAYFGDSVGRDTTERLAEAVLRKAKAARDAELAEARRQAEWAEPDLPEELYADLEEALANSVYGFWTPIELVHVASGQRAWFVRVPIGTDDGDIDGEEHERFATEAEAQKYCEGMTCDV